MIEQLIFALSSKGIEFVGYLYVWNNFALLDLPSDSIFIWLGAFLGVDFCYYCSPPQARASIPFIIFTPHPHIFFFSFKGSIEWHTRLTSFGPPTECTIPRRIWYGGPYASMSPKSSNLHALVPLEPLRSSSPKHRSGLLELDLLFALGFINSSTLVLHSQAIEYPVSILDSH